MSAAQPRERRTPKARRTRQQILAASLALFQERGFDRTSMRDIAARSGLSLGATYYHFDSKEELVFAFYAETQRAAEERARQTAARTDAFVERVRDVLLFKLQQLGESRRFVVVLARNALEITQPLSPFSGATRPVREGAIEILRQAIEGSDLRAHRDLVPRLPALLWLVQLAILFFWIHDHSENQRHTRRVVDTSLTLLTGILSLSATRLPGVGRSVALAVSLWDEIEAWGGPAISEVDA